MTEEIIIDCAFYKDGVCASPINKTCEYCKNIDVSKCYHKQLKRLEQENKDLKKQIESDKGLITVGGKQQYQYLQRIDKLEQENKELKEENIKVKKEFNNLIAEIISDMEYTGEIACNGESPKEHLHQMQKALSALEEIREIINGHASPSACEYWGSYKNACEPCVLRILNQVEDKIQNRINEVL